MTEPVKFELKDYTSAGTPDDSAQNLREEYLALKVLGAGVARGFQQRSAEIDDGWLLLAEGAGALALSAAVRMMLNRGGAWGQAANWITRGAALTAATDLSIRGYNTYRATRDAVNDPRQLESSLDIIANNTGALVVDYPFLSVATLTGNICATQGLTRNAQLARRTTDVLNGKGPLTIREAMKLVNDATGMTRIQATNPSFLGNILPRGLGASAAGSRLLDLSLILQGDRREGSTPSDC